MNDGIRNLISLDEEEEKEQAEFETNVSQFRSIIIRAVITSARGYHFCILSRCLREVQACLLICTGNR